jgi:hypothetical protein
MRHHLVIQRIVGAAVELAMLLSMLMDMHIAGKQLGIVPVTAQIALILFAPGAAAAALAATAVAVAAAAVAMAAGLAHGLAIHCVPPHQLAHAAVASKYTCEKATKPDGS